jgi:hypothetical protein
MYHGISSGAIPGGQGVNSIDDAKRQAAIVVFFAQFCISQV